MPEQERPTEKQQTTNELLINLGVGDVSLLQGNTSINTARNIANAIHDLDGFRARKRNTVVTLPDSHVRSAYVIVTLPHHKHDDLKLLAEQIEDEFDYKLIDVDEYHPDGHWSTSNPDRHDLRQAVLTPVFYSGYGPEDDPSSHIQAFDSQ